MESLNKYSEGLKKEILSAYMGLIRTCRGEYEKEGMELIRKSLDFVIEHTSGEQEKSGMHLALYAIGHARMSVREIGLDALGTSAVLIIHCVERCTIPATEVESALGNRAAQITEELDVTLLLEEAPG